MFNLDEKPSLRSVFCFFEIVVKTINVLTHYVVVGGCGVMSLICPAMNCGNDEKIEALCQLLGFRFSNMLKLSNIIL